MEIMRFVKMLPPDTIAFAHKDIEPNPMRKLLANRPMLTSFATAISTAQTTPNVSKDSASVRMVSKHQAQFVWTLTSAAAVPMSAVIELTA